MSIHQSPISRRTVLRGLGVSLALPWLESLAPRALAASATPAGTVPQRMAFMFVPNGVHLPSWTPENFGYAYDLPHILQPLAPVQDDVMVISGVTHDKGRANGDGAGDHARSASVFLTGAQPRKTDGSDIRSGVSVDQVAAKIAGKATRFASLELGCEPGRSAGNCDSGYSCAYSSNISWSSDSTPVGKETNPRFVFERLFGDGTPREKDQNAIRREALKKSVLDFISDDARQLQSKLGTNDRQKLDEYLESVRDVERRIENAGKRGELQGWRPTLDKPDMARPADGIPQDIAEHMRLMCDILVLGFQTDTTRITTLKLNNDHSSLRFPNLGVDYMIHHLLSHSDTADWLKVNQFFMEQVAYIARRLDAILEGERTLLDNTMLMYCSSMLTGNHDASQLPVIVVGGGGGRLEGGRALDYKDRPNRQMCRLYLSLMDKMGVQLERFGDADQPLEEV